MKTPFIKYTSAYGGQALKQKNKKNALQSIIQFFGEMAEREETQDNKINIFIEETEEKELDEILLSSFTDLFGKGKRELCGRSPEKQFFHWIWTLPYEEIDKCIDWFDSHKRFPKEFPPTIIVHYDFKWKENIFGKPYNEIEFNNTLNSISIYFSTTNSAIIYLNFPFEEVNDEFLAIREKILKLLPIELRENGFRLWLPTKSTDDYVMRKIKINP
jgi:hypothetical protein